MKEIIGYPAPDFLGRNYITLCSAGIKQEGQLTKTYLKLSDAWLSFDNELKTFLSRYKKNHTLIWRAKPALQESDNLYYIKARLTVYPDDIFKILEDKGFYFTKKGNPRFNNSLKTNINKIPEETWRKLL